MKTIVVGLGNLILGDDGVGIRVARELATQVQHSDLTIAEMCSAGLDFVDILAGYDKAIIIDALVTSGAKLGEICCLTPDKINTSLNSNSIHDINLGDAIKLGRALGEVMPEEMAIYGIGVTNVDTFSEECTPEIEASIPICVAAILHELNLSQSFLVDSRNATKKNS